MFCAHSLRQGEEEQDPKKEGWGAERGCTAHLKTVRAFSLQPGGLTLARSSIVGFPGSQKSSQKVDEAEPKEVLERGTKLLLGQDLVEQSLSLALLL